MLVAFVTTEEASIHSKVTCFEVEDSSNRELDTARKPLSVDHLLENNWKLLTHPTMATYNSKDIVWWLTKE